MQKIRNFIREEKGQAITEYVITTVFITLSALILYKGLVIAYEKLWDKLINSLAIMVSFLK